MFNVETPRWLTLHQVTANFVQIWVLELKDYLKNKIIDNGYNLITDDTCPYQKISAIYIYIYNLTMLLLRFFFT